MQIDKVTVNKDELNVSTSLSRNSNLSDCNPY